MICLTSKLMQCYRVGKINLADLSQIDHISLEIISAAEKRLPLHTDCVVRIGFGYVCQTDSINCLSKIRFLFFHIKM